MDDPIQVNDVIALRDDIPEQNLSAGRIGRVLEVLAPDAFEVEFEDEDGHTAAKVILKSEQFIVLRHESKLDEAAFWKLIEESKLESGGDKERQYELLVDKVTGLSIADIYAYSRLFHRLSSVAYQNYLWDAAAIICGGCSEDGFTDFRAWLIAQGQTIFYDALRDPETLVDRVKMICDGIWTYGDAQFESMNYVYGHAYSKKIGAQRPIFFDTYEISEFLDDSTWDEVKTKQKYPKLAAKFHGEPCDERTD